jgi:hypothetical protein
MAECLKCLECAKVPKVPESFHATFFLIKQAEYDNFRHFQYFSAP